TSRPAPDRRIPALRHAPGPTRPGGPGRSRHHHPRSGDGGPRRAACHPGPASLSLRPGRCLTMRIPNAVHEAHPWRIHEIAPDFTVEDVWALPAHGDAGDFQTLLEVILSLDFPSSTSLPTRVLWSTRDRLGRWFGLGRISVPVDGTANTAGKLPIPGT